MAVNLIWEFNGVELTFDIGDYDQMSGFVDAHRKLVEEQKELPGGDDVLELIKAACELYERFFDRIFGEGTGKKLFGGKINSRLGEEAVESFVDFVVLQKTETENRQKELLAKYKSAKRAKK